MAAAAFRILHTMKFEDGTKISRGRFVTDDPEWIRKLTKAAGAVEAPLEAPPPGTAIASSPEGIVENLVMPPEGSSPTVDWRDKPLPTLEEIEAAGYTDPAAMLEQLKAEKAEHQEATVSGAKTIAKQEPEWSFKTKSELRLWIEEHMPDGGTMPAKSSSASKLASVASAIWGDEQAAKE